MAIRDAELPTRVPEAALLAVARLVACEVPEPALFAAVCEEVAGVTGATATSVLRYSGDERAVAVGAWRVDGCRGVPVNAELDFDHTNSALGRARATRRPARADSYEDAGGQLPAVMRALGLRSTIAAPILVDDEAWGAVVASTAGEPPPEGSEHGLADFAELVAVAVARGLRRRRLAAASVRLVESGDASRRRLERRLHEGAHQHLVALALKLRVARAKAGPELAALLDDALVEAMATTASLRDLSRSLHPAVLAERGLPATLLALAARASVPVHLRELPARRFPDAIEMTVYLVAVEALADATARGAGEAGVRVADLGDHVVVKVDDDGDRAGRPGAGLTEVGERVAALGGVLDATAGLVRATVPLPPP